MCVCMFMFQIEWGNERLLSVKRDYCLDGTTGRHSEKDESFLKETSIEEKFSGATFLRRLLQGNRSHPNSSALVGNHALKEVPLVRPESRGEKNNH